MTRVWKRRCFRERQYGAGGPFCLEWRADNWDPRVTGADLVRSTYRLLSTESDPIAPARVPSAYHLTRGQEVRAKTNRLVATPALFTSLTALPAEVVVPLRSHTLTHDSTFICFVSEVGDVTGVLVAIGDLPKALKTQFPLFAWERDGFVIKSAPNRVKSIETVDHLRALLAKLGSPLPNPLSDAISRPLDGFYLFYEEDGNSLQAFDVTGGELTRYSVLLSEDAVRRLPPAYTHLKDIRVAIVGLGSLGGKIAVSLARCGCRQFLLVDDDILLPENICRHELSWMAVGMHKAKAIKEALSYIAPDIEVDARVHRLAGQESSTSAARVLKALASCHLIIDATADPDVFLRLAAVAQRHTLPMCWGEVFAGGVGG
jgi:hypothetical protein